MVIHTQNRTDYKTSLGSSLLSGALPIMRLIKQSIEKKDGSGSATLLPEDPEDMVRLSVPTPGATSITLSG